MAKKANGEGPIYRRKLDGLYCGFITLENGKRKYFYSKKRQEVYESMSEAFTHGEEEEETNDDDMASGGWC